MSRRGRQARPSLLIVGVAVVGGTAMILSSIASIKDFNSYVQIFMTFAGLLIVCIGIGGVIFVVRHHLTREKKAKASARLRAHDVDNMTGKEFETFLGTVLTARGYTIKRISHSQDGGVDIVARKDKEIYSIQAKRYKNKKADRRAITDAVAGIKFADCTQAMAITNSYFTEAATKYARKTGCILIDRIELGKWLVELSE